MGLNWPVILALIFFTAGFLMLIVGRFLPSPREASTRLTVRDQSVQLAIIFVLGGFVLLFVAAHTS